MPEDAPEFDPRKGEDNYQTLFANQKMLFDETLKALSMASSTLNKHFMDVSAQTIAGMQDHAQNQRLTLDKILRIEPSEAAAQCAVLPGVQLDGIAAAVAGKVIDAFAKQAGTG